MKNPSSPVPIAISMGDPAGVGPEVILKALLSKEVAGKVIPLVVGVPSVMRRAARLVGGRASIETLSRDEIREASEASVVYVIEPRDLADTGKSTLLAESSRTGELASRLAKRGEIAFGCVKEAARLCMQNSASALVTGPLSKASLGAAGVGFSGHTEVLRDLCRCRNTLMMFVQGKLKVSLATTHIPVGKVKISLTRRRVERAIILTNRGLGLFFGNAGPSIAVLSLNPHKGEGGDLGCEEETVIAPAIEVAKERGLRVSGPFAADSFFSRGEWRRFDATVAMYHDQGLVAAKLIGGERVTNVTLGLPFVRTSPGHGIAEDIAWKGIAEPQGMISAILLATELARTVRLPLRWD